jgi:ABC-2 type transport system ATP-binding protein
MALKKLNLEIPQGGVFGFLGPNGAGKTTTVKLLTGLLKPTEGECSVLGLSPSSDPCGVHKICGVMTESARMYGQLTGMENLVFFASAAGMSQSESDQRAGELLKQLDLWDARDKKLSAYSTGMAQRLSLARTLVHRPQVLFLDEPTSGLDPESVQSVNELIAELSRDTGTTFFLCTHQLRYAQDLCNGYGIIDKGNLLAAGDLKTLSDNIGCKIRAGFRLPEGEKPDGLVLEDGWWQTDLLTEEEMPKLLKDIIEKGHSVYEARLIHPTLEKIYFEYLERQEA